MKSGSMPWNFRGYINSRFPFSIHLHRLVGQVVRRPPRERKIPGSNPACAGIFSESSHTSDSKTGTPVATLPGAWRYRISAGTGWPGVSILWLGEEEVWSATSISVWQHVKLPEQICPWDTLAYCWDVKQPTNKLVIHLLLYFLVFCCCCCFFSLSFYPTHRPTCVWLITLFNWYHDSKSKCDYL